MVEKKKIESLEDLQLAVDFVKRIQPKIIFLDGPLGAGKTEFVKRYLYPIPVTSPTFSKANVYDDKYWHFDLYNIKKENNKCPTNLLEELGLLYAFDNYTTFVEWAIYLPENIRNSYKHLEIIFDNKELIIK
jgi:tRNA threonylcarbamoyl adenosine modification protein YjeE